MMDKWKGEQLLMFCNMNSLCIDTTYYAHKDINKKIWQPLNGSTSNELDYICMNKDLESTIQDVRIYRRAGIGSDQGKGC